MTHPQPYFPFAGLGTRFCRQPRPCEGMLPVADRAADPHVVDEAPQAGIEQFHLAPAAAKA